MRDWRGKLAPITVMSLLALSLGFGYQNCSPELPAMAPDAPPEARATPVPGADTFNLPSTGDGSYSAPEWEGVCTTSDSSEPMIINTQYTNYQGANVFFRRSDGALAVWNVSSNRVNRGVVCRMNGSGWTARAVGDFNGDGTLDVMWRNADGRNAVWIMNGAMRASGGFITSSGTEWHIEGVGDFNGDGKSDLLWVNWNTNAVGVWTMNGATVTGMTTLGGYAPDFHIVGTADFDGDRRSDILFRNNDGTSVVWQVASPSQVSESYAVAGYVANGAQVNMDNSWQLLSVNDVDGDAKADLTWMNTSTRVLRIAKMNKQNAVDARETQPVAANLTFIGTADVSKDGRYDLLFAMDNHALAVWTMNFIPQSGYIVSAIGTGWEIFRFEHH